MIRPPLALSLLALALAAWPAPSPAQAVKRCIDASGRAVFTDRACADVGAAAPAAFATGAAARGSGIRRGPLPGGCPRTAAQLAGELGAAVGSGDSNRLAGLYDWVGVSGAAASRVLDQLERVASRPLLEVAPVMSAVQDPPAAPAPVRDMAAQVAGAGGTPAPAPRTGPARWLPEWISTGDSTAPEDTRAALPEPPAPASPPRPAAPPRTVGLRVEQVLPGSAAPARTVFNLERRFGCLWLKL